MPPKSSHYHTTLSANCNYLDPVKMGNVMYSQINHTSTIKVPISKIIFNWHNPKYIFFVVFKFYWRLLLKNMYAV